MRRRAVGHRGDPRRRSARDGRGNGSRRHRGISGPACRSHPEAILGAAVESRPVSRYVALGSSMAAGPGIRPSAAGAPFRSGRSARNYAHLVAERLNLDLIDVTFSGATTAHVLADRQRSAQPQIEALDGSEEFVTITIGGNDVGYVPLLMGAALPALVRKLPSIRELLDRDAREKALDGIGDALHAVGTAVRQRAPRARVIFVDYLTLLPASG